MMAVGNTELNTADELQGVGGIISTRSERTDE